MLTHAEPLKSRVLRVPHGFFTRLGGVSQGPYASLNCSLSSGDSPDAIRENRTRVANAIDANPERLLGLTQVHGSLVIEVTETWHAGQGPKADAMVTARPGIALGIITADCAPVLLCDPQAGVAGAAHAGWRGAYAGILEATVAAMRNLGASQIVAVIGPCIQQRSYEVGDNLRDTILERDPTDSHFFSPGSRQGHWQFDLPGYCAVRLRKSGVAVVDSIGCDTLEDELRFFSHRRRTLREEGPIGHQMSAIMLR
jgi:YfiH family protein